MWMSTWPVITFLAAIVGNIHATNGESFNVEYQGWVGDGYCDKSGGYNTKECVWDGGDCCAETCSSTAEYVCSATMECKDPLAYLIPSLLDIVKPIYKFDSGAGNYCFPDDAQRKGKNIGIQLWPQSTYAF